MLTKIKEEPTSSTAKKPDLIQCCVPNEDVWVPRHGHKIQLYSKIWQDEKQL